MILWRLAKSTVYLTNDPHNADLFFVPILTAPKLKTNWPPRCAELANALQHHTPVSDWLPHLNASTAHRHFLIYSKEHSTAEIYNCSGWFWRPSGLFSHFMRIAYSHAQPESLRWSSYWQERWSSSPSYEDPRGEYPHLFSLPFPSSVHAILPRPLQNHRHSASGSRAPPPPPSAVANSSAQRWPPTPAWDTTRPRPLSMLLIANVDHGTRPPHCASTHALDVSPSALSDISTARVPSARCPLLSVV
jgi:hypothetical protein